VKVSVFVPLNPPGPVRLRVPVGITLKPVSFTVTVSQSFVELGGTQCGYCTPGFVVSAFALLQENPCPSDEQIKQYLAGNICRCTGFNKILAAVQQASQSSSGGRLV